MTTTPDPKIVCEIATEHILDDARRAHDIGADVLGHFGPDALTKHEYGAWCNAIREAITTATVAVSWPNERPQNERDARPLVERLPAEDAERVTALVDERDSWRKEVLELREQVKAQADLATELESANANAAEIADQRTKQREEIMRLRARVRELEGAQDERDGDVRAMAALLRLGDVSFRGTWLTDFDDARSELETRFALQIAALEARDAETETAVHGLLADLGQRARDAKAGDQ